METYNPHTWLPFCSSFPDIMDTSLLRSPAVFKLEKIGIGFKRLPEALFPQFLSAKFHLHIFSASCMLMAQS